MYLHVFILRSSTPVQDERGEEPGNLTATPQTQDGLSHDTLATPVLATPVLATLTAPALSSKPPEPLMNLYFEQAPSLPPPVPLMKMILGTGGRASIPRVEKEDEKGGPVKKLRYAPY